MKAMTEEHLAILRRHMVEVVDMHFDLASDEIGKSRLGERLRAALLAVRPAFADADPVRVLAAAAAMTGWALLIAVTYRRVRGLSTRPPLPGRRTIVASAMIAAGFAVIGGLVVIL